MTGAGELIICEYCDRVYRKSLLSRHEREICRRCGGVLNRHVALSLQQRLALSVTAAVLLLFANIYPIMSINLRGVSNSATLLDSVMILCTGPITLIALVVAMVIIIAPTIQVALLIWVLAFAMGGHRAPLFAACMRWLEALRPWSMLEVCLLGAIVAVVKLAGMLDVIPDIGLFALAILSILILAIAGRDVRELWGRV